MHKPERVHVQGVSENRRSETRQFLSQVGRLCVAFVCVFAVEQNDLWPRYLAQSYFVLTVSG